ncbi:STAS domain-containing protein [Solidesulfovibrio sp.]
MQFTCNETDQAMIVRLSGEIIMDAVTECKAEVERLTMETSCRDVVIDLADVAFMDSSGVGFLIGLRRLCLERGKTMTVANPAPPIKKLLDMLRLTDYFAAAAKPAGQSPA